MTKPLIIAHRGASELAPENTLAAFRRAIEDGAEGIEFDVRLSKDGVPVVIHDGNLKRVAQIDARVSDFTAAELQKIDVGSWFNLNYPKNAEKRFSVERISTLCEILEFLGGFSGLIYIELKSRENENIVPLVKAVCREIAGSHLLPNIIVKSFRLQAICEVRRFCPDVQTAALFAPKIMTILRKEKYLLKLAQEFKADQVSLHYTLVTRKLMEKAGKKNLSVTIWTADNPLWVKRALKLGIGAIITNNPARLLKKRREIMNKNSILN